MKFVFFDLHNGALLSEDGRVRPFTEDILEYCYESKIRVFTVGTPEEAHRFSETLKHYARKYIMGSFSKDDELPHFPDLVISTDSSYLNKFPGLLIPPYNPDYSNRWAEISLAGRLLDAIKDRVVLNRYAPDKTPERQRPEEDDEKPKDDPTSWAFEL